MGDRGWRRFAGTQENYYSVYEQNDAFAAVKPELPAGTLALQVSLGGALPYDLVADWNDFGRMYTCLVATNLKVPLPLIIFCYQYALYRLSC